LVLAGPKGGPKFAHSLATATKAAKQSGKPIVLVFSATWCGPCQEMKKSVYPSAEVVPLHDKFEWVYLDIDENEKTAERFKVSSIPHIEFLKPTGESIGQQVGSSDAKDFAKTLTGILSKAGS
jgi:thioredoxin-related protein